MRHTLIRIKGSSTVLVALRCELLFLSPDSTLMVAGIAIEPSMTSTIPQPLFPTNLYLRNQNPYAAAKHGQWFLIAAPVAPARSPSITVGFALDGEGGE